MSPVMFGSRSSVAVQGADRRSCSLVRVTPRNCSVPVNLSTRQLLTATLRLVLDSTDWRQSRMSNAKTRVLRAGEELIPRCGARVWTALRTTLIMSAVVSGMLQACSALAQPTRPVPEGSDEAAPGAGMQPGSPGPGVDASSPVLSVVPDAATGGPVEWTVVFASKFCGGPQIGGSVRLRFVPPLALPASIPAKSVQFDGQGADVSLVDAQTLQVAPGADVNWPHYCSDAPQNFTIVVTPAAGVAAPAAGGTYNVEFSTGVNPTPTVLQIVFADPSTGGGTPATD
jgi:hypothetical protein